MYTPVFYNQFLIPDHSTILLFVEICPCLWRVSPSFLFISFHGLEVLRKGDEQHFSHQ